MIDSCAYFGIQCSYFFNTQLILIWVKANWFHLVQTVSLVLSLVFTGKSLQQAFKAQQLSNLFSLTSFHREIWSLTFTRPELRRVLKTDVDLTKEPITDDERQFIKLLILHLSCTYEGARRNSIVPIENIKSDVEDFFSKPLPIKVWEEIKVYQNKKFLEFVDHTINDKQSIYLSVVKYIKSNIPIQYP